MRTNRATMTIFLVLSVRTIYDENRLETKKLLNIKLGWVFFVKLIIPVNFASPVSFIKQNVFHEHELRYPSLKINPVEKMIRYLSLSWGKYSLGLNLMGAFLQRRRSSSQKDMYAMYWTTITYKIRDRTDTEIVHPADMFSQPTTKGE